MMSTFQAKLGNLYEAGRLEQQSRLLVRRNRLPQAEASWKTCLLRYETALGSEDPQLSRPLRELAAVLCAQGRCSEAEEHYKRALALVEKAFYAEHYEVAVAAHDLAMFFSRQQKWAEAEENFSRAALIFGKCLQKDHRLTLSTGRKLAAVQCLQDKLAEAEKQLQAAFKVADTPLGPGEDFLVDLALLYQAQGKNAEAETAYRDALARYEQRGKPSEMFDCYRYFAEFLRTAGKQQEADSMEKHAQSLASALPEEQVNRERKPESHWRHLLTPQADEVYPATQLRS